MAAEVKLFNSLFNLAPCVKSKQESFEFSEEGDVGWIMQSQSKHSVSRRDRQGNSGGSSGSVSFRKGRFIFGTHPLCCDRFVAM